MLVKVSSSSFSLCKYEIVNISICANVRKHDKHVKIVLR